MRSALLSVFFALSAIRCWGNAIPTDFRPTTIPLEWRGIPAEREHRALGESEDLPTESTNTVKIPPHYWEDALRHSVYLTLVRDNIDALIARGEVIYPNRPKHTLPQELEDKDLWDKIKGASFDRIPADETAAFGDVSLVSSGKLVEEDGKYKFAETNKNTPDCHDCEIDAKALWSVKRMRHREFDTPGRYRYELTFSVVTQPSTQTRKPHENPARTFTVRESSPETINDDPRENRAARKQRAEKALWFHKNIYAADEWAPHPPHGKVHPNRDTDRMFTSLFMPDEKTRVYAHYDHDDAQRKYVNIRGPNPQYPPPPQIQKQKKPLVDHQPKKLTPYPYKSHGAQKLQRPQNVPVPHAQHHYLDIDAIGVVSSPYVHPPQDNRYAMPSKQKYAVPIHAHYSHVQQPDHFLPTPRPLLQEQQQPSWSNGTDPVPDTQSVTKSTPKLSESTIIHTKPKPTSVRIGYVTDHVRPPVYNTPPGVFVTMDKKPFKPLPPMKLHQLPKLSRPADFRPSPQVLDIHFSEPDPIFESFRPIFNVKRPNEYAPSTTEAAVAEGTKNVEKIVQTESNNETVSSTSTPLRKTRITSTTTTTTTTTTTEPPPSSTYEDIETMSWANLLGAFTGTTPSDITKTNTKKEDQTTESTVKASPSSTTVKEPEALITTTSSTTVKPTRPPYKPKNKHKRVTTTTTTTTTTTKAPRATTVEKPSTESAFILSSTEDLERTTTPGYRQITTTSTTSETAPIREPEPKLEYTPKSTNRYRLSTVMTKGTSVKHDKWSSQASEQKSVIDKASPVLGKYPSRRITSNFLGYYSTTERVAVKIPEEDDHERVIHITSPVPKIASSTEAPSNPESDIFESTRDFEDQANEEFTNSETDDLVVNAIEKQKQKRKEKLESLSRPRPSNIFSLKTNDRMNNDETTTTQKTIIASPHSNPKNVTKCKKKHGKKPIDSKTTEIPEIVTAEASTIEPARQTTTSTTTEALIGSDIFEELFGEASNNVPPSSAPQSDISKDDNYKDDNYNDEEESDIFDDFFGAQDDVIKPSSADNVTLDHDKDIIERDNFDYDGDLKEKEHHDHDLEYPETALDDILNDAEETTTPTSNFASGEESSYSEFSERPYSIFELMAME